MRNVEWVAQCFYESFDMRFNRLWDDLLEYVQKEWTETAEDFIKEFNEFQKNDKSHS